jgi:hypothetical protein
MLKKTCPQWILIIAVVFAAYLGILYGQQITALGYYSSLQGGFVPHLTGSLSGGEATRLFAGDGRGARRSLVGGQIFNLVIAGIGALAINAVVILSIVRS